MSHRPTKFENDAQLLQSLVGGDRDAAETVVDRLLPIVRRMAFRLNGWQADIQDVVQEVFLGIHTAAKDFRGDASLETWAVAITIRCCRKHRSKQVSPSLESAELVSDNQFMEQCDRNEMSEEVRLAMRQLSKEPRELLVLRYLEEWSLDELAEFYEVRKNTLEVRLNRARNQLGEILSQRHPIQPYSAQR